MSAAERRRELVEAAVRVMVRDGVSSVTTRAVVAEAGMTLGAFHYCFASKQELLREVTAVVIEREVRAGLTTVRPGRDVRELVADALHAFLRVVEERPEDQQMLFELTQYALRTPGQADLARLQYDTYREAAQSVLVRVAEAAGVEWTVPLPLAARTLISMLDGLTLGWLADRDGERARELIEVLAGSLTALTRPAARQR
jgi:AcrR family transcriptional regulator